MLWMVAMVEQNRNLGNVHRLGTEIVEVVCEHLNQTGIVRNICFGTVGKEGKPQRIDCQMSFDAISRLVKAKSF